MIEVKKIKNFVSGNFCDAVLSGRLKDDKIELNLKLDSEDLKYKSIPIYSTDFELLRNNPTMLIEYLLDNYLNNNTIIGIDYFTEIPHHFSKIGFNIHSLNGTFSIALTKDILKILPNDFVKIIENSKKEGIIKVLDIIDIKNINIDNFDDGNYKIYSTGIKFSRTRDGDINYLGLKIKDKEGKVINYKGEIEFIKTIISKLIEKENLSIEKLERLKNTLEYDLKYNRINLFDKYKLNEETTFSVGTFRILEIIEEFFNECLIDYEKEKVKQLILK